MRAAWGVLFLSLVVNTSTCLAQTIGASLQGTVYDPSGGFVPGATIKIRNAEQGAGIAPIARRTSTAGHRIPNASQEHAHQVDTNISKARTRPGPFPSSLLKNPSDPPTVNLI